MRRNSWLCACIGLLALAGCGDDSTGATATETDTDGPATDTLTTGTPTTDTPTTDTTTGDETTTDTPTTGMPTTGMPTTGDTDATTGPQPPAEADFIVRIENLSADTQLVTPFSPALWVEQEFGATPAFEINVADDGDGLEALAEDGDPSVLADNLDGAAGVFQVGVADTPEGADDPAPILPGEAYEFTFTAQNGSRLALLSMLGASNDVFVGTGPLGVALWTNAGFPEQERDISNILVFWDAGTEFNQPPGAGGYQGSSQAAANSGSTEAGVVAPKLESTRALPQAARVVDIDATYDPETEEFTIEIINLSESVGAIYSGFSPVLWAMHDDTVSLFTPGGVAGDFTGLEALAEDGDPGAMETALTGATGIDQLGVTGAVAPDGSVSITINPAEAGRFLSFVSMVSQTNDAFIGVPEGVALLDGNGVPRTTANIEADFDRLLAVWDAGTEANQVPGVGANQAPRQVEPNLGAADPDDTIRYYHDATDDLASIGDLVSVEITNVVGQVGAFDVTITNTSGGTAFPMVIRPVVYGVHDDTVMLFESGAAASPGLEELAEDGVPDTLFAEIDGVTGWNETQIVDTPDGAMGPGSLAPGDSYTFTVNATETFPLFNFAAMVVPSNDTFISLGEGISLFDGAEALDDEALATAVEGALAAWDAGTEANQAGAIGRDQAPRQDAPNTGANEGNGIIADVNDKDPVWVYPDPARLIRVTVAPVE